MFHSYNEALASAELGLRKMEQLGVAVRRPDDYFAEMVKNDDHMRKVCDVTSYHSDVRQSLLLGEGESCKETQGS